VRQPGTRDEQARVGRHPLPDVHVRIFDADEGTLPLLQGEVGEIASVRRS